MSIHTWEVEPTPNSLRELTPGVWNRPYQAKNVWEDEHGNRVIVNYAINLITLRSADGISSKCYDHREPFKSALRRNPNRRRAGLAAARRLFMKTPTQTKLDWLGSEEGVTLLTQLNIAGANPKVAYDALRSAFAAGFEERRDIKAHSSEVDRQLEAVAKWQELEPDDVDANCKPNKPE
jgi:hypothetical protein